MPRPCTKRRYRDRVAAELALATIRRRDDGKHVERRIYFCDDCHAFHLTSQTLGESKRRAAKAAYFRGRR